MEGKVIDYGVASGTNHKELLLAVKEGLDEGWQPYGQPFIKTEYNTEYILQAMVLYEVKKKTKNKIN